MFIRWRKERGRAGGKTCLYKLPGVHGSHNHMTVILRAHLAPLYRVLNFRVLSVDHIRSPDLPLDWRCWWGRCYGLAANSCHRVAGKTAPDALAQRWRTHFLIFNLASRTSFRLLRSGLSFLAMGNKHRRRASGPDLYAHGHFPPDPAPTPPPPPPPPPPPHRPNGFVQKHQPSFLLVLVFLLLVLWLEFKLWVR